MKKIYLGAFVSIFSVGMSVAQVLESPYTFDDTKIENLAPFPTNEATATSKALGVTFWTDDFSTPANWVADNDNQTAPFGWNVGSTVNSWWPAFSGGINSTSGGNFAEVYNGDYNVGDQAIDVIYTLTSASPIDVMALAGTDQVTLTFEQYGALFNDGQKVYVSTDNSSWTEVFTNNDRTPFIGNNPSAVYGNPETATANIASAISASNGGNPSQVWIRFEWTSRFPSGQTANDWTTFGWFIDDIALTTNADNDMTAESSVWGSVGLNYHQIPLSQQTAIEFTTNARNNGIATQTDVQLNVDVTGAATYSGSSPAGVSIAAGDYDSLVVATPFTPSGLGTYNVTWGVSQNEVDDIPTDNDNSDITFDVTNFTYARDRGAQEGTFSNQGDEFVLGSYYDIFANDNIYSIDIQIASNAVAGSIIEAKIYSLDPSATSIDNLFQLEDQSVEYTLTSSDVGSMINLDLAGNGNAGFPLLAGETYFVAVSSDGDNGSSEGATIGTTADGIPQTCFVYLPTASNPGWYYTLNTPMVRMNLDPASNNVGLEEQNQLFGAEVFPNPATDNVSVRYIMGVTSEVTIKVTDITGKVVVEFEEGTQEAGSHTLNVDSSSFAEGVYYVTMASGNSILTKKVVKK